MLGRVMLLLFPAASISPWHGGGLSGGRLFVLGWVATVGFGSGISSGGARACFRFTEGVVGAGGTCDGRREVCGGRNGGCGGREVYRASRGHITAAQKKKEARDEKEDIQRERDQIYIHG